MKDRTIGHTMWCERQVTLVTRPIIIYIEMQIFLTAIYGVSRLLMQHGNGQLRAVIHHQSGGITFNYHEYRDTVELLNR